MYSREVQKRGNERNPKKGKDFSERFTKKNIKPNKLERPKTSKRRKIIDRRRFKLP